MVAAMAPGSVVVDLAVEAGGNVEGSKAGSIVTSANGVRIVGHQNFPSRIAVDASMLYARNVMAFLNLLFDAEKQFRIDQGDEIIRASLLTMDGAVVNPALFPEPAAAAS
jgi:NAD(P) transhydrogenase subunit alpha